MNDGGGTVFDILFILLIAIIIIFSIFVLILIITIITLIIVNPNNNQSHPSQTLPATESWTSAPAVAVRVDDRPSNCLDEAASLLSYPKLSYSDVKHRYKDSTATCCSICLADYKDDDMLRLLPECKHLFHIYCVNPWLLLHPTCPVCRTSPFPSPMATGPTPPIEEAPLTASL